MTAVDALLLLSGFRGSGKDTFFRDLQRGDLERWQLYKHPARELDSKWQSSVPIRRGLADAIKEEVHADLRRQYPHLSHLLTEENKDLPLFPYERGLCSLRDLYIARGVEKKRDDIDYWCRCVRNSVSFVPHCNVVLTITDWRFPHEYDYFLSPESGSSTLPITTVRVFREAVPVPGTDIESERSLDSFTADYLAVPREEHVREKRAACSLFPQYSSFVAM
jgi:hypothetical protein